MSTSLFSVGFDCIGIGFVRMQGLDYSCSLLSRVDHMLTAEFGTSYLRLGGL